ncbi:hypothetical protein RAS1_08820 [Phycisphaerae bacterium RAS1]|nr:hypothetical protein RAS1_08820 [Phycisphaerae bacterium RAS1]
MEFNRANLTDRDRDLLDALTLRVRVLAVKQIAAEWFGRTAEPVKNARRRTNELARSGLVECFTAQVRPPLRLTQPIACWKPGDPPPRLAPLSGRLLKRWTAPVAATGLVVATRSAGRWMGGDGGRRPRRSEASHDLTVAAVYLNWRRRAPKEAEWQSEARLRRLGFGDQTRLPDAMVEIDGVRTVIEIGGAYSTEKLAEFHEFCWREGLPYEIW